MHPSPAWDWQLILPPPPSNSAQKFFSTEKVLSVRKIKSSTTLCLARQTTFTRAYCWSSVAQQAPSWGEACSPPALYRISCTSGNSRAYTTRSSPIVSTWPPSGLILCFKIFPVVITFVFPTPFLHLVDGLSLLLAPSCSLLKTLYKLFTHTWQNHRITLSLTYSNTTVLAQLPILHLSYTHSSPSSSHFVTLHALLKSTQPFPCPNPPCSPFFRLSVRILQYILPGTLKL